MPHDSANPPQANRTSCSDVGERAIGVGEMDVCQPRRGLHHHELRASVVAGDLRDAGGGIRDDAAGEGKELGEKGRQRGHDHRGEAWGRVDYDDEVDVERAEDEVELGGREHGGSDACTSVPAARGKQKARDTRVISFGDSSVEG